MKYPLSVQWHITTDCSNHCKHCYMYDAATYATERDGTLSFDGLMSVLERIADFEREYDADIHHIAITGGDPLLRKDWREFVGELRRRGKAVTVMGNPETITAETARTLSELGVRRFQLSLDGLEQTHDAFRSPGSFQRAIEKLGVLASHGISAQVMFTLYPSNQEELVPLLRYVATRTQAASFSFDLGCSVGNAKQLSRTFSPEDIRAIFSAYLAEKKRLRDQGCSLRIDEKPRLLNLVRFAEQTYYPFVPVQAPVLSGCLVGWNCIGILSNGSVVACRRMALTIGKLPEQPLDEIFLGTELLKKFRRPEYFEKCGACDFFKVCRGCPAHVHGLTGDAFAPNPLCFRSSVDRTTPEARWILPGPPLSVTYAEEWAYIRSRIQVIEPLREIIVRAEFQNSFLDLTYDSDKRGRFLADPRKYRADEAGDLRDSDIYYLLELFSGSRYHRLWPEEKGAIRDRVERIILHRMRERRETSPAAIGDDEKR